MLRLSRLAVLVAGSLVVTSVATAAPPSGTSERRPEKIGIIGAGRIGGTLAKLWVKAGHPVMLSSRHPDELKSLAASLGPDAKVGTPREASEFGDVVLLAVPYGAMPQIGKDLAPILKGKVVLDAGNPVPRRDGDMAEEARKKGSGVATAEYLPGAHVVRAFNTVSYRLLESEAHRSGEGLAIPLAGDDQAALATAQRLVREAGFDPVVVGGLATAKQFDQQAPGYGPHTATELKQKLGLP